jgi:hypothetical protein
VKYQMKEERELNSKSWENCDLAVAGMIGFVVGIIFGLLM